MKWMTSSLRGLAVLAAGFGSGAAAYEWAYPSWTALPASVVAFFAGGAGALILAEWLLDA